MALTTKQFDEFARKLLDFESLKAVDNSLNGIQVDNDGSELKKIAFAVDANMEVFKRAAEAGAGMIFVHHGLFWGLPLALEGRHRERFKFLLDNNLALYAVHMPLDQHPQLGNNAVMAELLGVKDKEPFALFHGHKIGYKGKLIKPLTVEEAVKRISFMNRPPLGVFPFGKKENLSVAISSGGSSDKAFEALEEEIDLFITGECAHKVYHHALEGRLNIVVGGHYSTEVWGVRRMMDECVKQLKIEAEFIDVPTGL